MKTKPFSKKEIKEIKESSLKFPYCIYEGINENDIVEIFCVQSIEGMGKNDGIPKKITIQYYSKYGRSGTYKYKLINDNL
jgi:hypothetical protein